MKLSTLMHIHKLLVEDETKKLLLKNAANLERKEIDEVGDDLTVWEDLNNKYKEAYREWEEAHNARVDFEEREW